MAHIGFKKLTNEIEAKGHGKYGEESAKAIAANIGRHKFGEKKMAKKAAAGRHKAAEKRHHEEK